MSGLESRPKVKASEYSSRSIIDNLSYGGKLSREKPFVNFAVLCLSAKDFSTIVRRLG